MKKSDRPPGLQQSLSPKQFDQFRAFIFDQSGIYFQDNKRHYLEAHLRRRIDQIGIATFEEYYRYVALSGNRVEIPHLISTITVNETYFLRSPEQIQLIRNTLLPQLAARSPDNDQRPIRIWSAACSTGEEPYSLALMLEHTSLSEHKALNVEIIGSDIDTNVLIRANSGLFNPYSVRKIPPHLLSKHFNQTPAGYQLKDEIRGKVVFKHINLTDPTETMRMHGIDIAICANVFIYFPEKTREHVLTAIYHSLNPGGFFLIGMSETLFGIGHPFQEIRIDGIVLYQKKM